MAWVVSNCKTAGHREDYVDELKKTVDVDIYGACGTHRRTKDIIQTINATYKFYLGFQNSLCPDYITEKFFLRQNLDVVVVVRGSGNYSRHYPLASFIDTRDYRTPQELGKYLLYLDNNHTAYIEYLKAKENYHSVKTGRQNGLCELCKMLHTKPLHKNMYTSFTQWYSSNQCETRRDFARAPAH